MPLSTDIRLPKSQTAKFPDRCVGCGQDRPNGKIKVSTSQSGLSKWNIFRRTHVAFPACSACAPGLRSARLLRGVLTLIGLGAGMGVAFGLIGFRHGFLWKLALMGVTLAVFMPFGIYMSYHPLAFDLTAYGNGVDYEFKDEAYAREFAAINGVEVKP